MRRCQQGSPNANLSQPGSPKGGSRHLAPASLQSSNEHLTILMISTTGEILCWKILLFLSSQISQTTRTMSDLILFESGPGADPTSCSQYGRTVLLVSPQKKKKRTVLLVFQLVGFSVTQPFHLDIFFHIAVETGHCQNRCVEVSRFRTHKGQKYSFGGQPLR